MNFRLRGLGMHTTQADAAVVVCAKVQSLRGDGELVIAWVALGE